jgi:hypothetical protein
MRGKQVLNPTKWNLHNLWDFDITAATEYGQRTYICPPFWPRVLSLLASLIYL